MKRLSNQFGTENIDSGPAPLLKLDEVGELDRYPDIEPRFIEVTVKMLKKL